VIDATGSGIEVDTGRASVMRNASVLAGATVAARLSMFAFGIVLARALGADSYGQYALALALGLVLQPIADAGLTPYLSREVARAREETERALPILLAAKLALLVATFTLTVLVAAVAIDDDSMLAVIAAVVLATLVDGFSMFVYGYFQGREAMGFEARATTLASIVRALGGIALALAFDELGPVMAWILAVSLIQAAVAARRLARVAPPGRPRWRSHGAKRVHWHSVLSMGLMAIFVMTYLRLDSVLIGWLRDERAVGLYAAAYTLMLGAQIVPTMLATALTPVFARTHARDRGVFESAWESGVRLVLLVSLPIALVTTLLAGPLIGRLYGGEFERSADVLALVIWICPLGSLSLIAQAALRGARRETWLTAVSGACAALNVGLNLWAISRYGIMGAAVVTVVTELLNTLALVGLCLRDGIVPAPRFPLVRVALAGVALTVVAVALAGAPVEIAGLASACAYVAVLAATRVAGREELRALRDGLRR
jgi:O-antigen/teichoic acid export membrane protein